ncbi:hypothetical protein [Noviherbaspirillum massiliense]|uniref:hypothetical protein n=1 Tax=Noviherbaspirillum massiliense TaxID=1465823 RepID=UPI0002D625B3|nr:hypothetical protein [Noviherbaspirillum massiliense]
MHIRSASLASILLGISLSTFACDPHRPEDFSAFFKNFSADKAFATSRTLYPSTRVLYQYSLEDGKQQITETRRKVTKQEDMKYLPLQEYVNSYGLTLTPLEVTPTRAVIEASSTGWQMDYHFSLSQGCWFLEEIWQHML